MSASPESVQSVPRILIESGESLYIELQQHVEQSGWIKDIRQQLSLELGVPIPLIDIVGSSAMPLRAFRVQVPGDGPTGSEPLRGLPAGALLVRETLTRVAAMMPDRKYENWLDHVQSARASVVVYDTTRGEIAGKLAGAEVLEPAQYALQIAATRVRRSAAGMIDTRWAAAALGHLPAHVATAVLEEVGLEGLTDVMHALLSENIPLVDLSKFAPALAYPGRVTWYPQDGKRRVVSVLPGFAAMPAPKPAALSEQRNAVARAFAVPLLLRRRAAGGTLTVWSMSFDASTTELLARPDKDVDDDWNASLGERVAACAMSGGILVVPPAARRFVWRRLASRWPDLVVVHGHELPRGVPLQVFRLSAPHLSLEKSA